MNSRQTCHQDTSNMFFLQFAIQTLTYVASFI